MNHQPLMKTVSAHTNQNAEFMVPPKIALSTTNSIAETASSAPSELTDFRNQSTSSQQLSSTISSSMLINRSHSANVLDSSQGSSNYTVDTNTTDSGISTDGNKKKKSSIWSLLSRNRNNDKQKSATLGREKHKKKKEQNPLSRDSGDGNIKHRWSTGASKLQPLPTTMSKEKLVSWFIQSVQILKKYFLDLKVLTFFKIISSANCWKPNLPTPSYSTNLRASQNERKTDDTIVPYNKRINSKISTPTFCHTTITEYV